MSGARRWKPRRAPDGPARAAFAYVATCEACGKRGYLSRAVARKMAALIHQGTRLRVYPCGDLWHITSVDAERTAMYRERRAS